MTDGTKADIVFQENITAEQEIWFNVPYISQQQPVTSGTINDEL